MEREDFSVVAALTSVSKALGGTIVLTELDLAVRAGEVTALLGPNGAGKTTCVSLLTGRLRPDAGQAQLFGLDPSRPAARGRMGVMLQSAGLPDVLTISEIVALQSGYYADPRPVDETLAIAGLTDLKSRRCGALSGGQARRVQYALAICGRPDLLVLDEPTVAMDREARIALWATVRDAADSGAAVLLTTHDLAEADALADRVLLMNAGSVIADDSPAAIRAQVGGSTLRCRTELAQTNLLALPAVRRVERAGAEAIIQSSDAVATVRALVAADPGLADLRISDVSLDDALSGLLTATLRIAA